MRSLRPGLCSAKIDRSGFSPAFHAATFSIRGEIRIPTFSSSSAAMRSSPQAGLSLAISTISFWSSAGIRGRPRGRDFHFQNSRKPCRCQRTNVSGLTIVRACRQGKSLESNTRVNLAAALGRRGSTWRPDTELTVCEGKDPRRLEYRAVEG